MTGDDSSSELSRMETNYGFSVEGNCLVVKIRRSQIETDAFSS